jgi:Spy/CpxP family protein refolding chaperone
VRKDGARKAGPRQHMEMLARKLNLTDEQRQQFRQIGQQLWQQSMSIRNDSSLTDEQRKEKLQALRKQSHMEMFSVLTPEQKGTAQADARAVA